MNKALLRSFMIKYGDTQAVLAEAMGLSVSCLNAKINGKSDFLQNEIGFIKDRYHLTAYDVDSIFFAEKVS